MNLEPGHVLARSYRLLHRIGEGGMGSVWVAEHIALDRRVAIKVMTEEVLATPIARDLFFGEARATAKIEHPNVVRVLDFDVTDDGTPFLVLELLVGETLEERIARRGPLSLVDARDLLEQLCGALGAAHALGFLHRDIKAENLFLLRSPNDRIDVRVFDFGITQRKNEPSVGLVGPVGTPQYMSPEQLVGEPVDERSDLFSAAICMYYALTATFPFSGDTLVEIGQSFLRRARPVGVLRPELPRCLDGWFTKGLCRDREGRFHSATEMWSAFDARVPPPPSRSPRDTPLNLEVGIVDSASAAAPVGGVRRVFRWATTMGMLATMAFAGTQVTRLEGYARTARQWIRPTMTAETAPVAVLGRTQPLGVSSRALSQGQALRETPATTTTGPTTTRTAATGTPSTSAPHVPAPIHAHATARRAPMHAHAARREPDTAERTPAPAVVVPSAAVEPDAGVAASAGTPPSPLPDPDAQADAGAPAPVDESVAGFGDRE